MKAKKIPNRKKPTRTETAVRRRSKLEQQKKELQWLRRENVRLKKRGDELWEKLDALEKQHRYLCEWSVAKDNRMRRPLPEKPVPLWKRQLEYLAMADGELRRVINRWRNDGRSWYLVVKHKDPKMDSREWIEERFEQMQRGMVYLARPISSRQFEEIVREECQRYKGGMLAEKYVEEI